MRLTCSHVRSEAWRAPAAVAVGFLAGSVPFSNIAARAMAATDLRYVGTGTVSGTALARVAGTRPLFVVGLFELAKGAAGPALAGGRFPLARAAAAAAAVVGHNWSPWLGGAGGRGISPAMGALSVGAPAGAAVLAAGLAGGRLAGETALGSLGADLLLVPACRRAHGRPGAVMAWAVLVPLLVKRLVGNGPPSVRGAKVYLWRLLLDRDPPDKSRQRPRPHAERQEHTPPSALEREAIV